MLNEIRATKLPCVQRVDHMSAAGRKASHFMKGLSTAHQIYSFYAGSQRLPLGRHGICRGWAYASSQACWDQ